MTFDMKRKFTVGLQEEYQIKINQATERWKKDLDNEETYRKLKQTEYWLVGELFGLKENEVKELSVGEYEEITRKIQEAKSPPLSKK